MAKPLTNPRYTALEKGLCVVCEALFRFITLGPPRIGHSDPSPCLSRKSNIMPNGLGATRWRFRLCLLIYSAMGSRLHAFHVGDIINDHITRKRKQTITHPAGKSSTVSTTAAPVKFPLNSLSCPVQFPPQVDTS